eukprot:jgi/Phyca11/131320/e_gw1.104.60.1
MLLHVDAILGVDALGAFGAVIDVEDRSMKLKKTGKVLQLGVAVVEMRFRAALAASVRLPPKSHALVMASVVGQIDEGATVLVEGAEDLSPMFRAARTLCTVDGGDATLSLVDKTVMRRLGRGAEPLEPYVGRVNSSSGISLRVRG